jgi:hypothetical protein
MKFVYGLGAIGGVIRETWPVWFAVFFVAVVTIAVSLAPKQVRLTEAEWVCTLAVPAGIETRCTEYQYKGGVK